VVVQDLIALVFGVPVQTDTLETDVTVGASVVQAVFTDSRRILLELSNTGATDITIRRDPNVTAPTGWLIPSKGNLQLKLREYADDVCRPLWAIGSAGGGTLHVREVVLAG
jgi:hypothetical protein